MNDENNANPLSSPQADGVDWSKLGWGVALVTAGTLLTLDRMADTDFARFWRYSPLILVLFGLTGLLSGKSPKARSDSWFLFGAGIYLLVNFLELWDFYWDNSWPLIPILIGLSMLIDPEKPKQRSAAFWPLGIGAFFLLAQGNFEVDLRDAWPAFLIAAGIAITWRSLVHRERGAAGGEE